MWLDKFSAIVDAGPIGRAVDRRIEILQRINPDNIYVENLREFFGLPARLAKFFCDRAVKDGVFEKRIGFLCPNHENIIAYVDSDQPPQQDEVVTCPICETEGRERSEFSTSELDHIEVLSVAKRFRPGGK